MTVSDIFHLDVHGNIVGHGMTIPPDEQVAPGVILLDIALLNRLCSLLRMEPPLERDRAATRRDRTRGAMEDLVEDLGLDPKLLDRQGPGIK